LRVSIDGRRVVDGVQGMLVVANCRQYALRMNPARHAAMTDGLLDVAFMPCRSVSGAAGWAVRCRLGRQASHRDFVSGRGREVHMECCGGGPGLPCQIDGESVRPASGPATAFTVSVDPGVLPVLLP
jgi:diacylglycerol kinase family enzyme